MFLFLRSLFSQMFKVQNSKSFIVTQHIHIQVKQENEKRHIIHNSAKVCIQGYGSIAWHKHIDCRDYTYDCVQRINNTLQSHNISHIEACTEFDISNVCAFVWCSCKNEDLWCRGLSDPHYLKIVQSYSSNNLSPERRNLERKTKQNAFTWINNTKVVCEIKMLTNKKGNKRRDELHVISY